MDTELGDGDGYLIDILDFWGFFEREDRCFWCFVSRYLLMIECGIGISSGFGCGKYDSIVPDFETERRDYVLLLSIHFTCSPYRVGRYSTSTARS